MTWREYVLQVMAHRRRVRTLGRYCLTPWSAGLVLCSEAILELVKAGT